MTVVLFIIVNRIIIQFLFSILEDEEGLALFLYIFRSISCKELDCMEMNRHRTSFGVRIVNFEFSWHLLPIYVFGITFCVNERSLGKSGNLIQAKEW